MVVYAPADMDGKRYDFAVLRLHYGEKADIMPDLDDAPKTVNFKTDRFSVYAIITVRHNIQ